MSHYLFAKLASHLRRQLKMPRFQTRDIRQPTGNGLAVAHFVPNTQFAVSSDGSGTAVVWDLTSSKPVRSFTGPGFAFENISFSPDSSTALTTGFKSNIHLWDLNTGKDLQSLPITDTPQLAVALSPDGTHAAVSYNNAVHLWTLASGALEPSVPVSASASGVAFTDHGKGLAWVQLDSKVCQWNLQPDSAAICKDLVVDDLAAHVAASKDGTRLLIGGHRLLTLWDVATASTIHTWDTRTSELSSIALSPDGNFALWSDPKAVVHLWDMKTGQQVASVQGPGSSDDDITVAFSDDGSLALLGGSTGKLRLWALR